MNRLVVHRWPAEKTIALVGLTGSIATGKSSASKAFRDAGVAVIDADQVARQVVAPGEPALRQIIAAFGSDVVGSDGRLDRVGMAGRIFADASARERLNKIVHPRVAAEVRRRLVELHARVPDRIVVYDVPLLFEAHLADTVDLVVVVHTPRVVQMERLMVRDRLTHDQAAARVDVQMDIETKARLADVVLDNRGRPEDLEVVVGHLITRIRTHNKGFENRTTEQGHRVKRVRTTVR